MNIKESIDGIPFAELVHRFGPRLFHYFRQRVASREECEDLVQETLVKAFRNRAKFSPGRKLSPWIFTLASRLLVDHFRSARNQGTVDFPDDLATGTGVAEAAAREEEGRRFWTLVRQLPARQYDALWLRYVEGFSVREISAALRITQVHTKVLLYRARHRLARHEEFRQQAGEFLKLPRTAEG